MKRESRVTSGEKQRIAAEAEVHPVQEGLAREESVEIEPLETGKLERIAGDQPWGIRKKTRKMEKDDAPLRMKSYLGMLLLFPIPIIGWIFCVIVACGGSKNLNKRHFARAYLICLAIGLLLFVLAGIFLQALVAWLLQVLPVWLTKEVGLWLGKAFEQLLGDKRWLWQGLLALIGWL